MGVKRVYLGFRGLNMFKWGLNMFIKVSEGLNMFKWGLNMFIKGSEGLDGV